MDNDLRIPPELRWAEGMLPPPLPGEGDPAKELADCQHILAVTANRLFQAERSNRQLTARNLDLWRVLQAVEAQRDEALRERDAAVKALEAVRGQMLAAGRFAK